VQALLKAKTAAGQSPRTVAYIRAVLRRALGQALKWGLVTRNVATLVDPPRIARKPVHPLTTAQVRTFLDATKAERLGPLFALRWDDLDFDAGTLAVRHAMQRVKYGDEMATPRFVEPKTQKSRRTLNLPASAVAAFRSQRVRQLEDRLLAGERWQGEHWGLVFTTTVGTPLNPSNVTHRLQRLLAEAGLPRQRFHDLRHCCASLMLAQHVPARVVMDTLGHSQISLTLNTYSHAMPAMQRDAADLLDELLVGNS
jgi:integrase